MNIRGMCHAHSLTKENFCMLSPSNCNKVFVLIRPYQYEYFVLKSVKRVDTAEMAKSGDLEVDVSSC